MKELNGFLEKIARLTEVRTAEAQRHVTAAQLQGRIDLQMRVPLDFAARIKSGSGVIAEIKRSSPSRGAIAPDLDPVAVAREYLENGASAISVLTEPSHFGGTVDDLERVRQAHADAALLMKDFVVEPYQVLQARAYGADAVLLIVALLPPATLQSLYQLATRLGLSVLVEVHDERELETAIELGAKLIGINNRDLKSLKTDLQISRRLAAAKPDDITLISESGIDSKIAMDELRTHGFDGFLIGTALMLEKTPGRALRALVKA